MGEDSTRWTVIRRAAVGDAAARAEFVRRYGPVIRAYLGARWRGNPLVRELDDAAQEVFVDCFRLNGALGRADESRGGFRGFLYGVVRNVALGFERTRARKKEYQAEREFDLDQIEGDDDPLSVAFDRAWASALLREAAALQLTHAGEDTGAVRRHALLQVRYGENHPIRDIAKRWDVEADWLHGQFRRARDEFRRALIEVVGELSGGTPAEVEAESRRLLSHFS